MSQDRRVRAVAPSKEELLPKKVGTRLPTWYFDGLRDYMDGLAHDLHYALEDLTDRIAVHRRRRENERSDVDTALSHKKHDITVRPLGGEEIRIHLNDEMSRLPLVADRDGLYNEHNIPVSTDLLANSVRIGYVGVEPAGKKMIYRPVPGVSESEDDYIRNGVGAEIYRDIPFCASVTVTVQNLEDIAGRSDVNQVKSFSLHRPRQL
jgi:hypothetical protein